MQQAFNIDSYSLWKILQILQNVFKAIFSQSIQNRLLFFILAAKRLVEPNLGSTNMRTCIVMVELPVSHEIWFLNLQNNFLPFRGDVSKLLNYFFDDSSITQGCSTCFLVSRYDRKKAQQTMRYELSSWIGKSICCC